VSNTAHFIHSSLITNIMVGLLFLKVFTGVERHVYLQFWTMEI